MEASQRSGQNHNEKGRARLEAQNYAPLRAHRGLNSYVAKEPMEEYRMDIMFLKYLEKEISTEEPLYEASLLMVDIFTKYCWAEPIIGKDTKIHQEGYNKMYGQVGSRR